MTKTNNTWVDVAENNEFGIEPGKVFINQEGQLRTASKKPKKTIVDTRGREMVVLNCNGVDTAVYVSDLLTAGFGAPDADNFNEDALKAAANRQKSPKRIIRNADTNETFKSFAACCTHYGFNYDQFYNAFYTKKATRITYRGQNFEIIDCTKGEQVA